MMTIEIDDGMLAAWTEDCSGYTPTLQGEPLATECCDPDVSLRNLLILLEEGYQPIYFRASEGKSILVEFDGEASYLATGFSYGEGGIATPCFAEYLAAVQEWRDRGFVPLAPEPARRSLQSALASH